jgi:hypothetical protein
MTNRVAEVNKALLAAGHQEKLTRGNGYYYFRDGQAASWPATSVYVYRSEDLSLAEWLEEFRQLSGGGPL